jgi:hypothetical protein
MTQKKKKKQEKKIPQEINIIWVNIVENHS